MKTAPNWHKSYTAIIGFILIVAPPLLDLLIALTPYIGPFGIPATAVVGGIILVARALPQDLTEKPK
jgi:hypothetical protein